MDILKIKTPEELFTDDPITAKKEYHDLAKKYHPDLNKSKEAVLMFEQIKLLYEKALEKFKEGTWDVKGIYKYKHSDGTVMSLDYLTVKDFELGRFYVGETHVTYFINSEHKKFVDTASLRLRNLTYKSDSIKQEVSRYLPTKFSSYRTANDFIVFSIPKTKDLLLLRDVLDYYKTLDVKHTAWIMSTIYNLCCYFYISGLVHNDISLDTYFISPEKHSGALLGGWWYPVKAGDTLKHIPKRTYNLLPWEVKLDKIARNTIDLELARGVCRELCKDSKASIGKAMSRWISSAAGDDSIKEYKSWGETLLSDFGKRRFTEMALTSDMIYKENVINK